MKQNDKNALLHASDISRGIKSYLLLNNYNFIHKQTTMIYLYHIH